MQLDLSPLQLFFKQSVLGPDQNDSFKLLKFRLFEVLTTICQSVWVMNSFYCEEWIGIISKKQVRLGMQGWQFLEKEEEKE